VCFSLLQNSSSSTSNKPFIERFGEEISWLLQVEICGLQEEKDDDIC
jgi:hypothetical protein